MKTLNMTVTSSSLVDLKNSAVHGLWFIDDFLSDFAVTFKPLKEMEFQGKTHTLKDNNIF